MTLKHHAKGGQLRIVNRSYKVDIDSAGSYHNVH
jgi:hypothetical protein